MGQTRGDGASVVSSVGSLKALHLRLSEAGSVEPAAGTGGRTHWRGDVVAGAACA